jgi:hypothetical protein
MAFDPSGLPAQPELHLLIPNGRKLPITDDCLSRMFNGNILTGMTANQESRFFSALETLQYHSNSPLMATDVELALGYYDRLKMMSPEKLKAPPTVGYMPKKHAEEEHKETMDLMKLKIEQLEMKNEQPLSKTGDTYYVYIDPPSFGRSSADCLEMDIYPASLDKNQKKHITHSAKTLDDYCAFIKATLQAIITKENKKVYVVVESHYTRITSECIKKLLLNVGVKRAELVATMFVDRIACGKDGDIGVYWIDKTFRL